MCLFIIIYKSKQLKQIMCFAWIMNSLQHEEDNVNLVIANLAH